MGVRTVVKVAQEHVMMDANLLALVDAGVNVKVIAKMTA